MTQAVTVYDCANFYVAEAKPPATLREYPAGFIILILFHPLILNINPLGQLSSALITHVSLHQASRR
jgi:hypothetical protein